MLSTLCAFIDESTSRNEWVFICVGHMHSKDHAACTQYNWHETRWWPSLYLLHKLTISQKTPTLASPNWFNIHRIVYDLFWEKDLIRKIIQFTISFFCFGPRVIIHHCLSSLSYKLYTDNEFSLVDI